MATQPIEHTGYGYTFKQMRHSRTDAEFTLAPETSKKRQESTAQLGARTGYDRIRSLLAAIPQENGSRLSFDNVVSHRDSIRADWETLVHNDLSALGVDADRTFRISYSATTGRVVVGAEHRDSMRIEGYFRSHSEQVEVLDTILQYDKLVTAAEVKLSPQQMGQELDIEAMGWWFRTNMKSGTLLAGGGMVVGNGKVQFRGLDILV